MAFKPGTKSKSKGYKKNPYSQNNFSTGTTTKYNSRYTPSSFRKSKTYECQDASRWNEVAGHNFQTLSKYAVLFPPARVGTGDLNYTYENGLREGPRIYLKGMKLWMDIKSKANVDMEVHVALIQKTAEAPGVTNLETDFFSNHIVGEVNQENFVSQTTTYDESQRYRSINSSRYKVFMHKKIPLGPEFNALVADPINDKRSYGTKEVGNKFLLERYFKINQTFEFESHVSSLPDRSLALCCWVCPRSEEDLSIQSAISFSARNVLYFTDLK